VIEYVTIDCIDALLSGNDFDRKKVGYFVHLMLKENAYEQA
jgi:hypothetical protein